MHTIHSYEEEGVLQLVIDSSLQHTEAERQNLSLPLLLISLSGESRELTDIVTKESSFPSLAANGSQLIQFPPALSDSAHDCI